MAGAASIVEHLITRVSMDGVENVKRGAGAVGLVFRGLKGDIQGMKAAWKEMSVLQQTGLGLGMMGAGTAGILISKRMLAEAAVAEAVQMRLATALKASGLRSEEEAKGIGKLANELMFLTGRSDEATVNAAAMLASFKMNADQIKAYLPRLLDVQAGLRKTTGEEKSLEEIAIMVGKGHMGMITGLRRVGIMVDENAYKTKGYHAIIEEIDKEFGGQAKAAMGTAEGSSRALGESINELKESLGMGLIPVVKAMNVVLGPTVRWFTSLNDTTKDVAGLMFAGGSAALVLAGGIIVARVAVAGLAVNWGKVAVAANAAAAAQTLAGAAGLAAGTAAGVGVGVGGAAKAASTLGMIGTAVPHPVVKAITYTAAAALVTYGGFKGYQSIHAGKAAPFVPGGRADPVATRLDKTNELLSGIFENTKSFKIIGGGDRAQRYISEADEQRAISGILGRAIA